MLEIITVRDDTAWTCLDMGFGLPKDISFIFDSWKCDVCWFFCSRTLKYVILRILLKENTVLLSICIYVRHKRDISTFSQVFDCFGHEIHIKHRKNCECCPGRYLIVNHYSSMSWIKIRNLSEIVNCVT